MKPACAGAASAAGTVRVTAIIQSARSTLEIQTFWPLTRKSSPSRRALVLISTALEPASGSVRPKLNCRSPEASPGSSSCFCSSVPWRTSVVAPKPGLST